MPLSLEKQNQLCRLIATGEYDDRLYKNKKALRSLCIELQLRLFAYHGQPRASSTARKIGVYIDNNYQKLLNLRRTADLPDSELPVQPDKIKMYHQSILDNLSPFYEELKQGNLGSESTRKLLTLMGVKRIKKQQLHRCRSALLIKRRYFLESLAAKNKSETGASEIHDVNSSKVDEPLKTIDNKCPHTIAGDCTAKCSEGSDDLTSHGNRCITYSEKATVNDNNEDDNSSMDIKVPNDEVHHSEIMLSDDSAEPRSVTFSNGNLIQSPVQSSEESGNPTPRNNRCTTYSDKMIASSNNEDKNSSVIIKDEAFHSEITLPHDSTESHLTRSNGDLIRSASQDHLTTSKLYSESSQPNELIDQHKMEVDGTDDDKTLVDVSTLSEFTSGTVTNVRIRARMETLNSELDALDRSIREREKERIQMGIFLDNLKHQQNHKQHELQELEKMMV